MNSREVWHVDVQNRIYEASFEEVIEWIKEGAILPEDKVRRGNLRWLRAGRVPEFHQYFFANEQPDVHSSGASVSSIETAENAAYSSSAAAAHHSSATKTASQTKISVSYHQPDETATAQAKNGGTTAALACSVHPEREHYYICQICKIIFCKECPHSFGSSVKICLDCGGLCITYAEYEKLEDKTIGAINRPYAKIEANLKPVGENAAGNKLSKTDFFNALLYPLKSPVAYFVGALLLTVFTVGQTILAIGGVRLSGAALGVSALTVMLLFSVLMKTVENNLHNTMANGFMPRLNKYTIWEDFIHPLLLGTGACLMTFGLFLALTIGAGIYAWTQFSSDLEMTERQIRQSMSRVDTAIKQFDDEKNLKMRDSAILENKLQQNLQNQADAVFGTNYLGDVTQLERLVKSMLRLSVYFQMPICFAFIFGCLFFPAVCSVAALTRSFGKTVNPLRSLKTIKKLGFDYVLIVILCLMLTAAAAGVASFGFWLFSTFDQSLAGVVVAIAAGCLALFYGWLVLAQIIVLADKRKNQALAA
jgi:hypothetical protein